MDDFQDALFAYVRETLAESLAQRPAMPRNPLRCDRWVARSALQKAIRRGETSIAVSALATLFEHDRSAAWRHMIVIAMEDVGVANIDVLAQIVAARLDRPWRDRHGGDWFIAAALVSEMAMSNYCQAACDLLLRATNSPELEGLRSITNIANECARMRAIANPEMVIEGRGLAAMALAGSFPERSKGDPVLAFDCLQGVGISSLVVTTCRAAWRATRNSMAFLLPLLWPAWISTEGVAIVDDPMPSSSLIDGVPSYAIDQFTRVGKSMLRDVLAKCPTLAAPFVQVGVPRELHAQALGDLLFMSEGGALRSRVIWPLGDHLRLPHRQLNTIAKMGDAVATASDILRGEASLIAVARKHHFHRALAGPL